MNINIHASVGIEKSVDELLTLGIIKAIAKHLGLLGISPDLCRITSDWGTASNWVYSYASPGKHFHLDYDNIFCYQRETTKTYQNLEYFKKFLEMIWN